VLDSVNYEVSRRLQKGFNGTEQEVQKRDVQEEKARVREANMYDTVTT
jgi:hypothetical protein